MTSPEGDVPRHPILQLITTASLPPPPPQVFSYRCSTDYAFLATFLAEEITTSKLSFRQAAILYYCEHVFPKPLAAAETMTHVVFPIMRRALKEGEDILSAEVAEALFTKVFMHPEAGTMPDVIAEQVLPVATRGVGCAGPSVRRLHITPHTHTCA